MAKTSAAGTGKAVGAKMRFGPVYGFFGEVLPVEARRFSLAARARTEFAPPYLIVNVRYSRNILRRKTL